MSRIRRWLSALAPLASHHWQPPASPSPDNHAPDSISADTCPVADWLPFRRIVDIPFDACTATPEKWQLTGRDNRCTSATACCAGRSSAITTSAPAGSRSAWPADRCARRRARG
jgi:hypothetical protein